MILQAGSKVGQPVRSEDCVGAGQSSTMELHTASLAG